MYLALQQFRPLLLGQHVLVHTDNTAAISYINRLGGIRSRHTSQLARHLLLWSFTQLKSLCAVSLLAQTLCKLREDEEFPELISLATAPPWHIPLRKDLLSQGLGIIWHPHPDLCGSDPHPEPSCVVPGRDAADLSGLPQAVVETITQARAPSTRQAYALKCLLANWCSSCREDPRRCTIGVVFSFMQERLERRLSPSTLKVYVSITIHHDAVDDWSLGKGGGIPLGHP